MKATLAILAICTFVLIASEANAQHRTSSQTHVWHRSHVFGNAYGYVARQAQKSRNDIYESASEGNQSFPNPDRDYLSDSRSREANLEALAAQQRAAR
jgi:hypothetical protein